MRKYTRKNINKKIGGFKPTTKLELYNAVRNPTQYGNIADWDISNITDMSKMFQWVHYIDPGISQWDTSNVTDMHNMFSYSTNFNANLNGWNVSKVTNMSNMFNNCINFNSDLSEWNVSSVTNMSEMFNDCKKFNGGNLNKWEVSNVKNMVSMFNNCVNFNGDLSEWDVSNVKNMDSMFSGCKNFNGDLSEWNVSNVINMNKMFIGCQNFNSDISEWDVSKVIYMESMFFDCVNFNSNISGWDVSNVKNMNYMFLNCTNFNQDLSKWNISSILSTGMFYNCGIQKDFLPILSASTDTNTNTDTSRNRRSIQKPRLQVKPFIKAKTPLDNSILNYTGRGFEEINGYLRGTMPPTLSALSHIKNIDEYFELHAKRITQEDVDNGRNIVWRGEKGSDFFRDKNPNKCYRSGIIKAYLSTSRLQEEVNIFTSKYNSVRCCQYKYFLSVGVPYLDVYEYFSGQSQHANEHEYLLPRGLYIEPIYNGDKCYEIVDVSGTDTYIYSMKVSLPQKSSKIHTCNLPDMPDFSTGYTVINERLGSNDAAIYIKDDCKYYVKFSKEEQCRSEALASQLYRAANIECVDIQLGILDGKIVSFSPWINESSTITYRQAIKNSVFIRKLQEGFLIDVLTANWDVVKSDNTKVSKEGNPLRIDTGGCLQFRARGGIKETFWTDMEVKELASLRTSNTEFVIIDEATMEIACENLNRLTDEVITDLVTRYITRENTKMIHTLIRRRDTILSTACGVTKSKSRKRGGRKNRRTKKRSVFYSNIV